MFDSDLVVLKTLSNDGGCRYPEVSQALVAVDRSRSLCIFPSRPLKGVPILTAKSGLAPEQVITCDTIFEGAGARLRLWVVVAYTRAPLVLTDAADPHAI